MSSAASDRNPPTPSAASQPELLSTTAEAGSPDIRTNEKSSVLGLRYHILRSHDKGGIGEVFVALDQELNREVALKEIQERHANDAPSRGRFVREAEITGGLEHPGIVPVYGLGQYADGRPYYAMRFIRGETLKDAIRKHHAGQTGWTLRALLMRFVTVCNTLAYAHSRGVIHRDIKPANIMLGQYGETLVVDWGMAKSVTEQVDAASRAASGSARLAEPTLVPRLADSIETQAGAALGTPVYMSPEQAAGRLDLLGPASDIYSLGCTLYTLLTGRVPLEGADAVEVLHKAQRGEWRPVRQVKPSVPAALAAICQKAMALEPAARYGTALALAADVEHWLADEPVAAYRESWAARSRRWMRRHRTLVSTAVGGLVVALLGATVSLVIVSEAKRQETMARQTAEDNEREARFHQYVAEMNLVEREYAANNIDHVRELLEAQLPRGDGVPDFRRFEWGYWQRLAHRELLTLQGHTGVVGALAFSRDSRRVASGGNDQTVRLWDAASGTALHTLTGHSNFVSAVSFSPDGQRLASASRDQTLRLWDVASGKELHVLRGHTGAVYGVCFAPDGRRLASAGLDKTVRLWDAETAKNVLTFPHASVVVAVTFRPDGRQLASISADQTIRIWNVASGKEVLTLEGHTGAVHGVAFSPDGRRLASAGDGGTVQVWDAATGKELLTFKGHTSVVMSVAFSPDGRRLASAGYDQTVRVWDAVTAEELLTLKGHTNRISVVAYRPDGQQLASGGWDATVRIWDAITGQQCLTLQGHAAAVNAVAFRPDGRQLVSVSNDRTVRVWDVAEGRELRLCQGHTDVVSGVAFSPDGRRLASASFDKTVRVWDAAGEQEPLILKGHTDIIRAVAFSPDGRRLASTSADGTVRVWDSDAGTQLLLLEGHTKGVYGVAFRSDGQRLASASIDQTVRVWDAATGQQLLVLRGHRDSVTGVSFSPNGQQLASASSDQTIRVWDADTGTERLILKGHSDLIRGLAFSPDGHRLASAGRDHTVRIWDADTGKELLALKGHTNMVMSVAFSPDGRRLASTSADGTVRVWEGLAVPAAIWRQRGLVNQVNDLFAKPLLRKEVQAALRNDPTLDEADRQFALEVAQSHREDPLPWNEAAWKVIRFRDAGKDAYARALLQAETALRLAPADDASLNTLGVAQYRAGHYADALTTLMKAEKVHATPEGPHPADLVFLAMTQHQLGNKNEARATLDRLRQIMRHPRWAQDAESAGFLREAEELIAGGANKKP